MSARQHWCDCAQAPVFEGMCNGCDWPTRLDARDAAIEAECVPLDDTRICPGCNGFRVVELPHGHDPYRRGGFAGMTDTAIDRVAEWLDGATDTDPPRDLWACVEIFGHRKHYGRIKEIERFGTKMLRVDVPTLTAAPLLGEDEKFESFLYGGGAVFSVTPMTEEAARKWAEAERPRPYRPLDRLPAPDYGDDEDLQE